MNNKQRAAKHAEQNLRYYYKCRYKYITMLGGKCVNCGETNYDLLEFDHIDPFTKTIDISTHITSPNLVMRELPLVQLLCKKCHKIKSMNDFSKFKMSGELNHAHKLTTEQVIEIRYKYSTGEYSYNQLAREYGVSKTNIINIVYMRQRIDM